MSSARKIRARGLLDQFCVLYATNATRGQIAGKARLIGTGQRHEKNGSRRFFHASGLTVREYAYSSDNSL